MLKLRSYLYSLKMYADKNLSSTMMIDRTGHDMTTPTVEEEEVITSGRKEGRLTTLASLRLL